MCRHTPFCTELGQDPAAWSKVAPLPPPAWYREQLWTFRDAVQALVAGRREKALTLLRSIRSDEMRNWFDEHGQMSGFHRNRILDLPKPLRTTDTDPLRSPVKFERIVFERDGYRCRYCGLEVIPKRVLAAIEHAFSPAVFRITGTNAQQHGIVHAFKAVADHVVPHRLGGRTNPENLVTACPACNYGKDRYTVEQLGIEDPRQSEPVISDWDGLSGCDVQSKQEFASSSVCSRSSSSR